jgi:hypothetical protein
MLRQRVTVSGSIISNVNITNVGKGYVNGEILGITSSFVGGGSGAQIGVKTRGATDTIYLTNVQGEIIPILDKL